MFVQQQMAQQLLQSNKRPGVLPARLSIRWLPDTKSLTQKVRSIRSRSFIIDPTAPPVEGDEYAIDPKLLERYVNATRCINCFCCVSACITDQKNFLGPNAMLASIVRMLDPREKEKEERLKILYCDQGPYRCRSSQAFSFVCPKEIDVAHFMALAKEGDQLIEADLQKHF